MSKSSVLQQSSFVNEGDLAAMMAIPWSSSPPDVRIRPPRTGKSSFNPQLRPLKTSNAPSRLPPAAASASSSTSSLDPFATLSPVDTPANRLIELDNPLLPLPPASALTGAQRRRLAMLGTLAPSSSTTTEVEPLTLRRVVSDPQPLASSSANPAPCTSTSSHSPPLPSSVASTSSTAPRSTSITLPPRKRSSPEARPRPTNKTGNGPLSPPPKRAKTTELAAREFSSSSSSLAPASATAGMARSVSVGSVEGGHSGGGISRLKERETKLSRSKPWENDLQAQKDAKRKHLASLAYSKPNPLNTSKSLSIKAKVVLSPEQQQILKMVVQDGLSLFFTGSAGTGKSVLLREIIASLRTKHGARTEAVAVTASTGLAGCNIGGSTIHSFAGIGLGIEPAEELAKKVKRTKKHAMRWMKTKVWIIDEVSMVDADLFDKLSQVGKIIRKNNKPFGGIQIIVTGDFFQLPPVTTSGQPKFAFEAKAWEECISRTVNLTQVFRQKDQEFVDMLNEMRFGTLTASSIAKFKSLSRPVDYSDGLEPTELFPLRGEVDKSNLGRLKGIKQQMVKYLAQDGGAIKIVEQREKLLANMMAPKQLELKVGSQVMLIKNIDETLVNGSVGRVLSFQTVDGYQAYKRSLLVNGTSETADVDEKAKEKPAAGKNEMMLPIVEFAIPGGGKREYQVVQEKFSVEAPNGEIQASRTQIPLVLAWAMSIHKSQGQTIERVRVDLSQIFEKGQAYVALSRATSMDSLQVIGFDPLKVQCHPKVKKWSENLESLR